MTTGYIEAQCTVPSSTTLTATNATGGPTSVSLTAGTYYMTALVSHVQSALNAQRPGETWTVALSTTTGLVTISISSGVFSITWTTAELGTMLGHATITAQSSVVGATAVRGIFVPDRPLNLDGDPRVAPPLTDLRSTEGPTGLMFGVVGNQRYEHTGLRYAHVSRENTWDTDSGVTPSWQRFLANAHLGQGHSWFSPCSKVKIVDQTGAAVGDTSSVTGWQMRGVTGVTPTKMSEAWTGAWLIEIPAIVSDGT